MAVYWIYDHALATKADPEQKTYHQLIESGLLSLVQFRAKGLSREEFKLWAEPLIRLAQNNNVTAMINDLPDLALELKADGVHVGQQDMSVSEARELLGSDFIIGATARREEEAAAATEQGADHLGIGTIFDTTTKQGLTTRGPEFIAKIQSLTDLPLYPIGGIDESNIHLVKKAGAEHAAVASCLFGEKALENLSTIERTLREGK